MSTEPKRPSSSRLPTSAPGTDPASVKPAVKPPKPGASPAQGASSSGVKALMMVLIVLLVVCGGGLGFAGWMAYSKKAELEQAESKIKQAELARSAERKELNKTIAKFEAAEKEAADNDTLFDFLAESLIADTEGNKDASKMPLSAALDRAAERLEGGEFKDRPALELQLRRTVGHAYLRIGIYEPAELHLRRAYELTRELAGSDDSPDMLEGIMGLATVLAAKGETAEATTLFTRGLELYHKFLQDEPVGRVGHLTGMAQGAIAEGKFDDAVRHYGYIVAILERQFGKSHPLPILGRIPVAQNLKEAGNLPYAESMSREVVSRLERILPEVHPNLADAMASLAGILVETGKYEEAERYARKCLKIREAVLPKGHWQRYSAMCIVGEALAGQQKNTDAEKILLRGYKGLIAKKSEAPTRRKREACEALVRLYGSMDQPENVEKYQKLANKYSERRRSGGSGSNTTGMDRG